MLSSQEIMFLFLRPNRRLAEWQERKRQVQQQTRKTPTL